MKAIRVGGWVILALLTVVVVAAPLGPLPGLFIGGTPAEAPARWPDTSSVHEIRLRVPGILPRVVIIWVIEFNDELYVVGDKGSTWVSMIGEGGPVEMRLGDDTYSLTALPVEEGWQPIYQAYLDKYRPDYPDLVSEFPLPEEGAGTGAIFLLSRNP